MSLLLEVLYREVFSHEKVIAKVKADYLIYLFIKQWSLYQHHQSAVPGNLLEIQYPSQATKSEILGVRPSNLCLNISSPINRDTH